jgi:hypothetical protein
MRRFNGAALFRARRSLCGNLPNTHETASTETSACHSM